MVYNFFEGDNVKKVRFLLLAITLGLLLTACSMNKKPITPEKFVSTLEGEKFEVVDAISQFEGYDYISNVYVAMDSTSNYQIEYFNFDSIDTAKKYYKQNKEIFEESKDGKYLTTNLDLTNSNKFEMSSDKEYKLVLRIDNIMIYVNTKKEYKSDIDKIIKKLGY